MVQTSLISTAEAAIFSILQDQKILDHFCALSFDKSGFKQGEDLCKKYGLLDSQLIKEQNRARDTSHKLKEARRHLKLRYMRHLSIARLTFKDIPEHWERLGIDSERYPELQSWVKQAQRFYLHAKPMAGHTSSYGIAHHELEEVKQILEQIAELAHLRKQAMSYMQMITQRKQECYAELEQWMQKFSSVACIALAHEPQILESLGILTNSKAV